MRYEESEILKIIDNTVVSSMNKEDSLFGNSKRIICKNDIYSKSRKKEIVVSRQMSVYLAYFVLHDYLQKGVSLQYIGNIYGLNHATVIHCRKTIKGYIESEKQILRMVAVCTDAVLRKLKDGDCTQAGHRWYTYMFPKSDLY